MFLVPKTLGQGLPPTPQKDAIVLFLAAFLLEAVDDRPKPLVSFSDVVSAVEFVGIVSF
jgi:hypothetical protein